MSRIACGHGVRNQRGRSQISQSGLTLSFFDLVWNKLGRGPLMDSMEGWKDGWAKAGNIISRSTMQCVTRNGKLKDNVQAVVRNFTKG
jgi:hypothetical protein